MKKDKSKKEEMKTVIRSLRTLGNIVLKKVVKTEQDIKYRIAQLGSGESDVHNK